MKKIPYLIIMLVFVFVSCEDQSMQGVTETGTGGSMARFTIKGDYLYSVDFENLHVFNINNPQDIIYEKEHQAGFGIETIFPFGELLFLGAQNGMHIYSIENPANPEKISFTPHFVSYDPVVVQGDFAYVTLRSDFNIGRNLLQVYDITNLSDPQLLKEYNMTGPRGLGVDGDQLFVCDDVIKIYDIGNGVDLTLKNTIPVTALDVIPMDNILYVVATDGLYQYTYDSNYISLLSKITISYETDQQNNQ